MVAWSLLAILRGEMSPYGSGHVHELRTDLGNVLLALQLLRRKARPDSGEAKVIQAGLSSAYALADRLLGDWRGDSKQPGKLAPPRL